MGVDPTAQTIAFSEELDAVAARLVLGHRYEVLGRILTMELIDGEPPGSRRAEPRHLQVFPCDFAVCEYVSQVDLQPAAGRFFQLSQFAVAELPYTTLQQRTVPSQ